MGMVVPGRCWNTAVYWTAPCTEYGILGPFAEGDYIRRVLVAIGGTVADHGRFAASLGRSGEATAEAHGVGVPLIQRSPYDVDGIPQMAWVTNTGGLFRTWLPLGIGGDVGSRYLVFVVTSTAVATIASCVVGAEVLRFEKGPKELRQA